MQAGRFSRSDVRWAAAILGVAFAVRTVIAFGRGWIGYDEANYLMIARNAGQGLGWVQSSLEVYQPKFHLLSFLAPQFLTSLLGDALLTSKVIFIVLGTLTVALVGGLGAALFGLRAGLVAAGLTAVAPVLTSLLVASISHSLFLPFFVAGLWCCWNAVERGRPSWALLAGLAIGASWWARADGLVVAPALAFFLLVAGTLLHGLRRSAVFTLAYGAGFAALYALYGGVVNAVTDGTAEQHGPLFDFLSFHDCNGSADAAGYDSFLSLVLNEPGCIVQAMTETAQTAPEVLLTWTGFPMVLLPLVGVAWVATVKYDRRTLAAHLLLLSAIASLTLYLPFHFRETRYVAPYATVAFLWCGLGLVALGDRLEPALKTIGRWLPTAAVTAGLLAITILHVPRMESLGGTEYVETGKWIADHTDETTVVWTFQSQVGFYTNRPWEWPPARNDAEAWRRLATEEVILVIDDRQFFNRSRAWSGLSETAASNPHLDLVHTVSETTSRVRLYRVLSNPLTAADERR